MSTMRIGSFRQCLALFMQVARPANCFARLMIDRMTSTHGISGTSCQHVELNAGSCFRAWFVGDIRKGSCNHQIRMLAYDVLTHLGFSEPTSWSGRSCYCCCSCHLQRYENTECSSRASRHYETLEQDESPDL